MRLLFLLERAWNYAMRNIDQPCQQKRRRSQSSASQMNGDELARWMKRSSNLPISSSTIEWSWKARVLSAGKYLALGASRRPREIFNSIRASLDGSFLKILGSHPNPNFVLWERERVLMAVSPCAVALLTYFLSEKERDAVDASLDPFSLRPPHTEKNGTALVTHPDTPLDSANLLPGAGRSREFLNRLEGGPPPPPLPKSNFFARKNDYISHCVSLWKEISARPPRRRRQARLVSGWSGR